MRDPASLARLAGVLSVLSLLATACDSGDRVQNERAGLTSIATARADVAGGGPNSAAALSVFGEPVEEGKSEYARAVDCAASLDVLTRKLQNTPMLDSDQKQALAQTAAVFRARALSEAGEEGKTPRQLDADL